MTDHTDKTSDDTNDMNETGEHTAQVPCSRNRYCDAGDGHEGLCSGLNEAGETEVFGVETDPQVRETVSAETMHEDLSAFGLPEPKEPLPQCEKLAACDAGNGHEGLCSYTDEGETLTFGVEESPAVEPPPAAEPDHTRKYDRDGNRDYEWRGPTPNPSKTRAARLGATKN